MYFSKSGIRYLSTILNSSALSIWSFKSVEPSIRPEVFQKPWDCIQQTFLRMSLVLFSRFFLHLEALESNNFWLAKP